MKMTKRFYDALKKTGITAVGIITCFYLGATISWFWEACGITVFGSIVLAIIFVCFYGDD